MFGSFFITGSTPTSQEVKRAYTGWGYTTGGGLWGEAGIFGSLGPSARGFPNNVNSIDGGLVIPGFSAGISYGTVLDSPFTGLNMKLW